MAEEAPLPLRLIGRCGRSVTGASEGGPRGEEVG